MYDKVSPNLNFVERERKTEKFWEDNHIFQKSIDERKEKKERFILSMTDLRLQTVNRISVTF